jgi:hypothetical protein
MATEAGLGDVSHPCLKALAGPITTAGERTLTSHHLRLEARRSMGELRTIEWVVVFFVGELLFSRLLYRFHLRDQPY